nr:four helix bundle protein [Lacinutrix sp. Hel_I_90]
MKTKFQSYWEKKKTYNLERRTFEFARDCRFLVKELKNTISNIEDGKQLVRSSGSVGANYIEGNEKLGDKDLLFKLRISRKEAKESEYWLKLLKELNENESERIHKLLIEANELRKILSSIVNKLR